MHNYWEIKNIYINVTGVYKNKTVHKTIFVELYILYWTPW